MPSVSRSESFATIDGDASESIAIDATTCGSVLISAHATAMIVAAAHMHATSVALNRRVAVRRMKSGIHALDERGGDIHKCLCCRICGVARHYRLTRGKRVGCRNRTRHHLLEDHVRWQVLAHVFHDALARRISGFEHCEDDAIEDELFIHLDDALNSAKDLRWCLQRERLAL